jgi:PKD repeat protein
LGAIQARIRAQGDSLDADSLVVTVTGITADDSVVSRRRTTGGAGGELLFSGLPPAIYEVELSDVQGNCTVEGGTTRTAAVTPLGTDTVTYAVNCEGSAQEERPFKVRSRWSPNPAPTGQRVELEMSLDMGADPSLIVCLVEGAIKFDDAILRFDAARPGDLSDFFAVGNPAAGLIALSAISASGTSGASIVAARLDFTVLGAEGAKTRPSVNDLLIAGGSDCGTQLDTLFNVVTDTLVVGTGPGNTPPTANAGGPYSGFVGTPIAFDGSGSSDPEDNIVAWAWEFGDGATGSGATASHTYSADGNFTARLTVTDALGESDSDETSVQVALPGNAPPVAEAGGPYSGRVGEPVAFDGSGSTDPDGSVVSWDWDFGDAETGSGAVLDHTYDQPGSYTATLTVADNEGDTDSDAASVVISDTTTATDSVVYTARFGTVDPGSGTVALTLSIALPQDIPQSAGDEAIDRWTIAPLAWDPAVLAYQSAQFAPGGAGSVSAGTGQLTIRGFQPPSNNTGNITLITVRFQVVGSSGTLTTTTTTFTELLRTSAPGEFDYLPYLVIREGTLVVP